VRVPAVSWIQTIQVQETGGFPVWLDHVEIQHGRQFVGFEQIALWNPDKKFMVVWPVGNHSELVYWKVSS